LAKLVDGIVSSHELGKPKEDSSFWADLEQREPFQREATLMVDDSFPVLEKRAPGGHRPVSGHTGTGQSANTK